jgi:hypothetical protein
VDIWRLSRLPRAEALARLFKRMARCGRKLANLPQGATPYELSERVSSRLEALGQAPLAGGTLIPAMKDVSRLTELHARASYSARPPKEDDLAGAFQIWRRLRWRLWAARIIRGIRERGR